jgi:hypothetical protein
VKIIKPEEDSGNNRSVMPLDAPGCTRATMIIAVSFLQSSCVAIKIQFIIFKIILCYFKCFTYLYDYPTSKVSGQSIVSNDFH